MKKDPRDVLRPAELLIIVPPFLRLVYSTLGPHLLQALARREGVDTRRSPRWRAPAAPCCWPRSSPPRSTTG